MSSIREQVAEAIYNVYPWAHETWANTRRKNQACNMADAALSVIGWKPIDEKAKEIKGRFLVMGGIIDYEVHGQETNTDFCLVEVFGGQYMICDGDCYSAVVNNPTRYMEIPLPETGE